MRWISYFFFISLAWSAHAELTPDEHKAYDELEGLSYVRALVRDAKFSEALKAIGELSERAGERGVLLETDALIELQRLPEAQQLIQQHAAKSDKLQARFALIRLLQKKSQGGELFEKIPDGALDERDTFHYQRWALGESPESMARAALRLLPRTSEDSQLDQLRLFSRAGLKLRAHEWRSARMRDCATASFYLKYLKVLEEEMLDDDASYEHALACHPQSPEVILPAVQYHFRQGKLRAALALFERLAASEAAYHHHVAEFMQAQGLPEAAYYRRLVTPEQSKALKARAVSWVNGERFGHFLAAAPTLGPLMDEPLRYAYAFALFKHRLLSAVAPELAQLKSQAQRQKGEELLKLTQLCREQEWRCRP